MLPIKTNRLRLGKFLSLLLPLVSALMAWLVSLVDFVSCTELRLSRALLCQLNLVLLRAGTTSPCSWDFDLFISTAHILQFASLTATLLSARSPSLAQLITVIVHPARLLHLEHGHFVSTPHVKLGHTQELHVVSQGVQSLVPLQCCRSNGVSVFTTDDDTISDPFGNSSSVIVAPNFFSRTRRVPTFCRKCLDVSHGASLSMTATFFRQTPQPIFMGTTTDTSVTLSFQSPPNLRSHFSRMFSILAACLCPYLLMCCSSVFRTHHHLLTTPVNDAHLEVCLATLYFLPLEYAAALDVVGHIPT